MKVKKIVEKSTNRIEFNKAYKIHLERTGKIHCSRCGYNRGENNADKYYYINEDAKYFKYDAKIPSWKLETKNRKQWMKKNRKLKKQSRGWKGLKETWYEIII